MFNNSRRSTDIKITSVPPTMPANLKIRNRRSAFMTEIGKQLYLIPEFEVVKMAMQEIICSSTNGSIETYDEETFTW